MLHDNGNKDIPSLNRQTDGLLSMTRSTRLHNLRPFLRKTRARKYRSAAAVTGDFVFAVHVRFVECSLTSCKVETKRGEN